MLKPPLSCRHCIHDFLSSAMLADYMYEDALTELGCATPQDLHELEEGDFLELGMKQIEVKRMQQTLATQM